MKRSIAIAGNMGSGKSTLVEFLHRTYGVVPFYEPNDENPYLADFYKDMKRWAFPRSWIVNLASLRSIELFSRMPKYSPRHCTRCARYPSVTGRPIAVSTTQYSMRFARLT
jgi:hypothetical protein